MTFYNVTFKMKRREKFFKIVQLILYFSSSKREVRDFSYIFINDSLGSRSDINTRGKHSRLTWARKTSATIRCKRLMRRLAYLLPTWL